MSILATIVAICFALGNADAPDESSLIVKSLLQSSRHDWIILGKNRMASLFEKAQKEVKETDYAAFATRHGDFLSFTYKFDEAAKWYQSAIASGTRENIKARLVEALILGAEGPSAAEILKMHELDELTRLQLCAIQAYKLGDFPKTVEYAQKGLKHGASETLDYMLLLAYLRTDTHDSADEMATKLIRSTPCLIEEPHVCHFVRAFTRYGKKEPGSFQDAIVSLQMQETREMYDLIWRRFRKCEPFANVALACCEAHAQLAQTPQEKFYARKMLAEAYADAGLLKECQQTIEQLLPGRQKDEDVRLLQAVHAKRKGGSEKEVVVFVAQNLASNPVHLPTLLFFVDFLITCPNKKYQDLAMASDLLDRIGTISDDPELDLLKVTLFLNKGDLKTAEKMLERINLTHGFWSPRCRHLRAQILAGRPFYYRTFLGSESRPNYLIRFLSEIKGSGLDVHTPKLLEELVREAAKCAASSSDASEKNMAIALRADQEMYRMSYKEALVLYQQALKAHASKELAAKVRLARQLSEESKIDMALFADDIHEIKKATGLNWALIILDPRVRSINRSSFELIVTTLRKRHVCSDEVMEFLRKFHAECPIDQKNLLQLLDMVTEDMPFWENALLCATKHADREFRQRAITRLAVQSPMNREVAAAVLDSLLKDGNVALSQEFLRTPLGSMVPNDRIKRSLGRP